MCGDVSSVPQPIVNDPWQRSIDVDLWGDLAFTEPKRLDFPFCRKYRSLNLDELVPFPQQVSPAVEGQPIAVLLQDNEINDLRPKSHRDSAARL
mgnify:CR=1 FL=1